jgi:hypothetical protein
MTEERLKELTLTKAEYCAIQLLNIKPFDSNRRKLDLIINYVGDGTARYFEDTKGLYLVYNIRELGDIIHDKKTP